MTCHKTFEKEKKMNILLELCENGDLEKYLEFQDGVPLPESQIWKIFSQICFGLLSLHQKNILHRDLKTANIFLTEDFTVKIGDLGIARQMEHTNQKIHTSAIVGTLPYMSPEQFNGTPYSLKSDVWALGCLLYHLCSYKGPYDADNLGALCNKVLNDSYDPIPDIYSTNLKAMVDLLLTKDQEVRPSITEILRSGLMADYLKSEGYEPAFIGTASEKLTLVI